MTRIKENIINASNNWVFSNYSSNDYSIRNVSSYTKESVVLIGMRRLGKTEYLKYRKDLILNNNIPDEESNSPITLSPLEEKTDRVLFIDFDSPIFATVDFSKKESKSFAQFNEAIISLIQENKYEIVLIDEIQERIEWSKWLKGLSDLFKTTKFIATGSDAMAIDKSSESGLDRFEIISIGPLSYLEFYSAEYDMDKTLINYLDNWVFPTERMNKNIGKQYQQVYEKQFENSGSKNSNIMTVLKYIYLNPGIELNIDKTAKRMNDEFLSEISSRQLNKMLDFLVNSKLVLKIPNQYTEVRLSKRKQFRLYPSNWNLYKIETQYLAYSDLGRTSIPRKGLVFENMMISSILSSVNNPSNQSKITYYKDGKNDYDISLLGKNYEIKSFDFIKYASKDEWQKLKEKTKLMEAVIHTGKTTKDNGIKFINAAEFLKEEKWKIEKN
ncbi:MAG: ATP-binding protein [Mycoplasmataceae bacterium]|nr:ATP-binding protein [Mycoplasmataceae bacterium]